MFTDESQYPAISECKSKISSVLQDINSHRREVRLTVRLPALEYTMVQGTEVGGDCQTSDIHCSLENDIIEKKKYNVKVK